MIATNKLNLCVKEETGMGEIVVNKRVGARQTWGTQEGVWGGLESDKNEIKECPEAG